MVCVAIGIIIINWCNNKLLKFGLNIVAKTLKGIILCSIVSYQVGRRKKG